jgi:hypothetical protein
MKYLLINPPVEEPDYIDYINNNLLLKPLLKRKPFFHSASIRPLGLLKISSYLKKNGHDVDLINCVTDLTSGSNSMYRMNYIGDRQCGNYNNERISLKVYHLGLTYDEFRQTLLTKEKPDKILVTSMFTYNNKPVHRVIDICKEVFPDIELELGGIYATLCYKDARKSKADRIQKGKLICADSFSEDLDILGYPADYSIIKVTSGCPNKCTYCAVHKLEGDKLNFRDPFEVFEEIKDKIKRYNIKKFIFWESNLLFNFKSHFDQILDLIISNKLDIEIDIPEGLQPNLVTQEIANKFVKAGLKNISLPLEVINDDFSKQLNRPSNTAHLSKSITFFRKAGLNDIGCFILIGLPNQKLNDILSALRFVWQNNCKPIIMPYTPIPGTDDYDKYVSPETPFYNLHPVLFPLANSNLKVKYLMLILLADMTSLLRYVSLIRHHEEFLKLLFSENELEYINKVINSKKLKRR